MPESISIPLPDLSIGGNYIIVNNETGEESVCKLLNVCLSKTKSVLVFSGKFCDKQAHLKLSGAINRPKWSVKATV